MTASSNGNAAVNAGQISNTAHANDPVRSRRVYYISGFDPRGAAFYHRLYRDEAGKQALHHGARIAVGPRIHSEANTDTWAVDADWDGQTVATEYQFLVWDDIVRRHWEPNLFKLLASCLRGSAHYITSGAFSRLRKVFRGPLYTAIYPITYMLILLAASILLGYGAGVLVSAGLGDVALATGAAIAGLAGIATGVMAGAAAFWGGVRFANRLGIFWLLRTYLFVFNWGAKGSNALDTRIDRFTEKIMRDQSERPCDEVLLVGHSVGSMVAISVAARLTEKMPQAQRRNLTLLTLGQCIPLLSLLPGAGAFRKDMAQLAGDQALAWLDMNARADSLCFSQANPLDISGLDGHKIGRPTQQVVRPFRMFAAAEYARLRRNKLRLHFQYLMASALPNEYDYFRMTAGPGRIKPF